MTKTFIRTAEAAALDDVKTKIAIKSIQPLERCTRCKHYECKERDGVLCNRLWLAAVHLEDYLCGECGCEMEIQRVIDQEQLCFSCEHYGEDESDDSSE